MGKQGKIKIAAAFLAGALLAAAVCGVYFTNVQSGTGPESRSARKKISILMGLVEQNYLNEYDEQELTNTMLKGLIGGLEDTYAAYYTADEYKSIMSSTTGAYSGVGMIMQQDTETGEVTIVGCYEGTPAWEAGIESGDVLVSIDGMIAAETDLNVLAAAIRNSDAESVHIVWMRDGEEMEQDIVKSTIEIPVVSSKLLEEEIGYIRITQFTASTAQQFSDAYEELLQQNMSSLIVDLRDNPGGLMDGVVDTLNVFMPEGLLVYTQDKDGSKKEYTSSGDSPIEIPLVVLVNENSASASEIFAGAVQDYQVGTIVGTQTYGKGIVQKTYPLQDGSAVKMTTAYYYTPNGACIHGTGIQPDEIVEIPEDGKDDLQLKKAMEICHK